MRPIPPPQVPLIDPKTGKIDEHWYKYLLDLEAWRRRTDERLTALETP